MTDAAAAFRAMINDVLGEYAPVVEAQLLEALRQKKVVLSEALLQSVRADVVQASSELLGRMELQFADYGRIREMRGATWGKQPPIEVIEEFIRRVGLQRFSYVPGYTSASGQWPTYNVAVNRIAWGIARAKLRDPQGKRAKAWFNKTYYRSLNVLLDQLTRRYTTMTGEQLAAGFSNS